MSVRVRFAPSPTGFLHVGGARTALFNWLFARHHQGTFVLRVEDTDRERSTPEAVQAIYNGMRWLGLDWDEGPDVGGAHGPYLQTEREAAHRAHIEALAESAMVYPCYDSPEQLKVQREAARASGSPIRYHGRDEAWTMDSVLDARAQGKGPALVLKVPAGGTVTWTDRIKGPITFDYKDIDDFIIVRGDGTPTYNFAVTLDDADMGITHVIRGDDHTSNTPKQLLLYDLLGASRPEFGHVPMILGPDGAKLSKRHGATSVEAYRDEGFVPEAMINYLALLGWALDDRTEVFSREDLIQHFTLDRVGSTPSVFDTQKLTWMNGVHLRGMSSDTRAQVVGRWLERRGLWPQADKDDAFLDRLVHALGDRIKTLPDVETYGMFAFSDTITFDDTAVAKVRKGPRVGEVLDTAAQHLAAVEPFDETHLESVVSGLPQILDLKPGQVFQPLRVAVTGKTISPGIHQTLALLGRDRCLERLHAARPVLAGGAAQ